MTEQDNIILNHLIELKEGQARLEAKFDTLPCKEHGFMIENNERKLNELNRKIPMLKIWLLSLMLSGVGAITLLLISKHLNRG